MPMARRPFIAHEERTPGWTHILLITTGSVASIKAPLIVADLLTYENVKVEVVATKASLAFFDVSELEKSGARIWRDEDEWGPDVRTHPHFLSSAGAHAYGAQINYARGDPILHIELRRWADTVLIAPCSANTLAKIAHGLCDNLATSVLRALAPTTPTYVFPAMNTLMYEHPLTAEHLRVLRDVIGYEVVGPIGKTLACGDVGESGSYDGVEGGGADRGG
ncbi:putative thymidylate synthase [Grifola frondosa]|uniref:Putative thymidylate synthase n=1 Tax=Grifola frondosa TaxID=5627 RepID=A0A1C7LY33_GRIFR|nr:putative thymidylate synthase [Grifola frondosa]